MRLSDRLERIAAKAAEVTEGYVADVGTDHGFVPIRLMETGTVRHVVAMDVRKGPLSRAAEHVREYHMEDRIETRLSDGLQELKAGEADTVIIAGMGGELEISILEDLDELKNVKDSDSGKPIIETLSAGLDKEVTALTADKTKADNANGVYQVVKVTTNEPFPQVLNYLAHQSAGILNKEAVTEMNSKFDVEIYDATKDVCYGDAANIKSGNNHLWMSGPYALVSYDDYQVVFEKNSGYMAGTEHEAKISILQSNLLKMQPHRPLLSVQTRSIFLTL